MTTTMQLIAKQTVGAGGAASVTFSNIPQTYTDLKVVFSARSNQTQSNDGSLGTIKFNGSSTSFTFLLLRGNGSAALSTTGSANYLTYLSDPSDYTASTFSNGEVYIPNYTSSNNKSTSVDFVQENNATTAWSSIATNLWSNTAAINSIELAPYSGSFVEFSTFYLYGISNSTTTQNTTVPYASGGDVITTDGSYWYHAFKYSGSFTPLKNLTADILVVAGGGGSGRTGGGGGAGGLRGLSAQALTSAIPYTCTIGAGGAGGTVDGGVAASGVNSSFAGSGFTTITASGGGGGASYNNSGNSIGVAGGSGGGGGTNDGNSATRTGGAGNAGSYSPVEGYAGGAGVNSRGAGGGGGASAAGTAGTTNNGGAGGNGSSAYSSWGSATTTGQNVSGTYYYAGGGGGSGLSAGGAAGYGGAGAGGTLSSGSKNATANTGGGAGSNNDENGYQGGSGIIIVRYAV